MERPLVTTNTARQHETQGKLYGLILVRTLLVGLLFHVRCHLRSFSDNAGRNRYRFLRQDHVQEWSDTVIYCMMC